MDKMKVAILGGSGYTAVELIKILLRHPHAEIAAVTSRQDAARSPTCTRACSAGSTCGASRSTPTG